MDASSEIRKGTQHHTDTRNWKLIHDPFLRKGLPKLYRYDGSAPGNPTYNVLHVSDPRSLASRLLTRSESIDLPVPTFAIDDNYVGRPAMRELAFFELNDNVNNNFLSDMCKRCGVTEEVKVFYHPTTKRHLGVARVVFRTEREAKACLEKYNQTSVMGTTVKVVADPWGKLAKEAAEQSVNKNQHSQLDQAKSRLRSEEGSAPTTGPVHSLSAAASVSDVNNQQVGDRREADVGHRHLQTMPANASSSSPAVHAAPPTPSSGPNIHPDDPSSQFCPSVAAPYGTYPPFPPPLYQVPPWPTAAAPTPWPVGITAWPPPWSAPLPPPGCVPPAAGSVVAEATTVEESKPDSKGTPSPTKPPRDLSLAQPLVKESDGRRSSLRTESSSRKTSRERAKSRLEPCDRHFSSSPERSQRGLTLSPEHRRDRRFRRGDGGGGHHQGSETKKSDHHSHYRNNKNRETADLASSSAEKYKRRIFQSKSERDRQRSPPETSFRSRSVARRKSAHRSSSGTSSDGASRKRRHKRHESTVESVDEEEEYYWRSKTSQQPYRRTTSRSSKGKESGTSEPPAAAATAGRCTESRKSGGSEYCDEIEEFEYYRRKRRQRRLRPQSPSCDDKCQQDTSSKTTDIGQQLQDKFEVITSSEDEENNKHATATGVAGESAPREAASSKPQRRPSSATAPRSSAASSFGKLERISCSSDDDGSRGRLKKKLRRKETIDRVESRNAAGRRKSRRRAGYARSRSGSTSSTDSDSASSRTSSDDSAGARRRYRRHYHQRRRRYESEDRGASSRKRVKSEAKMTKTAAHERECSTKSAAVCDRNSTVSFGQMDSLETRIQQLLGVDHQSSGIRPLTEETSTPVQDEHNASSMSVTSKQEKTSDVEMSLSSGEEDQYDVRRQHGAAANESSLAAGALAAGGNGGAATQQGSEFYCHPMYLYPPPNYLSQMPPSMPAPVGFPMWTPTPPFGQQTHIRPVRPFSHYSATEPKTPPCKPQTNAASDAQLRKKITQQAVTEVRAALKAVLRKDVLKRTVDASVFQSIDSWFAEKELEQKVKSKEMESEGSKRPFRNVCSTGTPQQVPFGLALSGLFDTRSSSELTPSLTGLPGIGLRASLPKLPSFKRKIIRPPTPPSPSPRRRGRTKSPSTTSSSSSSSSSSCSTSESEDECESTVGSDHEAVSRDRLRASRRVRLDSSRSATSGATRSRSSSDGRRRVNASAADVANSAAISSDEGPSVKNREIGDETDDKRMEPISDTEIEDEDEHVREDASSSPEDLEAEAIDASTKAADIVESEKVSSEDDIATMKRDKLGFRQHEAKEKEATSPLVEQDNSPSKSDSPRRGRGRGRRRGRLARIPTTTEDECSGQENVEVSNRSEAEGSSCQQSSETVPAAAEEAQNVQRIFDEGVMYVDESARYNPAEFDHYYTQRLGETPPPLVDALASGVSGSKKVLKPKQTIGAELDVSRKQKTKQQIVAQKPSRPAITFKPRSNADESRICYEFLQSGIDDEDISFMKMVYDNLTSEGRLLSSYLRWAPHVATTEPPYKKLRLLPDERPAHSTGSARTEGFYRLSHKEQRVKSRPRQVFEYTESQNQQNLNLAKQQLQFSREARALQRRLLATLGAEVDSDLLKYNQLKFRKKNIKFARSHIHGWGLFSMEDIAQDEMIVEYVGQKIRITVAEKREKKYEKMGVGSSYLFRIDNEMVVDATKRGNIARFINHSCNPNCYAKIVTVEGEKRIVIYSKQNISRGEEITYDYKFPLEDEKIPCNCGAPCCRGSLN